jgi:phosphoglycolate phosphatase-like HAD superfamily hydrolase
MVIDRKQIFIATSGNAEQQLNKIKQIEWNGLEKYLKAYFIDEINPRPSTDALLAIMQENELTAREVLFIGKGAADEIFASAAGIDYLSISNFV